MGLWVHQLTPPKAEPQNLETRLSRQTSTRRQDRTTPIPTAGRRLPHSKHKPPACQTSSKDGEKGQVAHHQRAPPLHGHDGLLLHLHPPPHIAAHEHDQIRPNHPKESPLPRAKTKRQINRLSDQSRKGSVRDGGWRRGEKGLCLSWQ